MVDNELNNTWYLVYKSLLDKYHVTEAIAIAQYYKPKKIYKYFCFDKNWKSNIFDGSIVFNIPHNFNDPHDSKWFLNHEEIIKARFKDIGEEWKIGYKGMTEELFEIFKHGYEEDLAYLQNIFKVSCFSETQCSNLMWGHYANKHTGFCIEYDVEKLPSNLQLLLPVVYSDTPFNASPILDMRNITDKYASLCPMLFKSRDWSYEREWRMFKKTDNNEIQIEKIPEAITGIYFGLHSFKQEKRNEIETWALKKGIPTYQMEKSYCSYDLIFEKIDDIKANKKMKGFLL